MTSSIKLAMRVTALTVLAILLASCSSVAQDIPANQSSAQAVARASFEALKSQELEVFVSLFHPEELERFKKFALDVFIDEEPDEEVAQIRKLLAPFEDKASVSAASGSEIMLTFLKTMLALNPELEESMKDAELEILGELEEAPNTIHVITRTVLPRPSPVSCRQIDGRWYQLLSEPTLRLISTIARKSHFLEKDLSIKDMRQSAKMGQIEVFGHVHDGETSQVLCRITMTIDDFTFPVFGCYPVREGEPAWEHLHDEDDQELVETLRAKWSK